MLDGFKKTSRSQEESSSSRSWPRALFSQKISCIFDTTLCIFHFPYGHFRIHNELLVVREREIVREFSAISILLHTTRELLRSAVQFSYISLLPTPYIVHNASCLHSTLLYLIDIFTFTGFVALLPLDYGRVFGDHFAVPF